MRFMKGALVIWCSVAFAGAQTGTSTTQGSAQEKQKGMMQAGMAGMMEHCQMHCRDNMTAMNALSKQIDEARQSNDPAKMRAALDAVAKHHAGMRQHMQTCMQNMRSGDAKPGAQAQGHEQHHGGTAPAKK